MIPHYDISFIDGTLTITDKEVPKILMERKVLTYGEAFLKSHLNAKTEGEIAGNFSFIPEEGTRFNAGLKQVLVTFTPENSQRYTEISETATLTVNKAELTITVDHKSRRAGEVNPVPTASYSGFVLGEDSDYLVTPVVLEHTVPDGSTETGDFDIVFASGPAATANYEIKYVPGVLTVEEVIVPTLRVNIDRTKNPPWLTWEAADGLILEGSEDLLNWKKVKELAEVEEIYQLETTGNSSAVYYRLKREE